jgi:hypothetical protein
MNMSIQIDSKKLGHFIGIALSGVMFVSSDPTFIAALPPALRPWLHTFLALIPWFTMMGINVGQNAPQEKK